jgi:hypothetical protein
MLSPVAQSAAELGEERRTHGHVTDLEVHRPGRLLRPAVTLPIEIYGDTRIREFDEAEAELEKVKRRKKRRRSAR